MHQILVIDDDTSFNQLLVNFLNRNSYQAHAAYSAEEALKLVKTNSFQLLLVDYKLPKMNGLEVTQLIKQKYPNIAVILMTNYADLRIAVNSIKIGAFDFVSKPIVSDELLKIIKLSLEPSSLKNNLQKTSSLKNDDYLLGENEKMKALWHHVNLVAPTKMNVLIIGESGSGKEHIAKTIHQKSHRKNQPFVAIDCGAINHELAGSEFFGHVKGAFTGADNHKIGLFEEANGGTLFLDEVGNMPYAIQIQLLRAIQEKSFKKVGDTKSIAMDVRIIAATNEMLLQSTEKNTFRLDLFHRLNEFEIHLPPLRERLEDLNIYIDHFIQLFNTDFQKQIKKVSYEVFQVFQQYHWPGNLRELKNIIKRAVLLSETDEIQLQSLPNGMLDKVGVLTNDKLTLSNDLNLKENNKYHEATLIQEALKKHQYNKSKAAKELNIDRTTLYKKIKFYNLDQ
ncbi:MAG: sigma-54-dependent transcriptional regulator [Flavobacterium sp.]